jgi:hypothetical protein
MVSRPLLPALRALPADVVLNGKAVAPCPKGFFDFHAVRTPEKAKSACLRAVVLLDQAGWHQSKKLVARKMSFIIGQFSPQPIAVTARQRRPIRLDRSAASAEVIARSA